MKVKAFIKNSLFKLLSGSKGYSDLSVLSGPAKGTKLRLDLRKEGSYWLGTYDKWLFESLPFSNFIKPGDVVWDCGAYVGYYAAVYRKLVGATGKVYVFEASSDNYSRLKYLPEINGWSNVVVLNKAVGPDHTVLQFVNNIGGSNGPYNLAKKYKESITELEIEEVECCGVDELIYEKGIPAPSFIKFDLESAEEFALHNGDTLFKTIKPVILLELHGEKARDAAGLFFEKYLYTGYLVHDAANRRNGINSLKDLAGMKEIPFQILCIPQ